MENHRFKYLSLGYSAAGCGYVVINLEREDGTQFGVILSAEDAKQLLDGLPQQVRIAAQNSN